MSKYISIVLLFCLAAILPLLPYATQWQQFWVELLVDLESQRPSQPLVVLRAEPSQQILKQLKTVADTLVVLDDNSMRQQLAESLQLAQQSAANLPHNTLQQLVGRLQGFPEQTLQTQALGHAFANTVDELSQQQDILREQLDRLGDVLLPLEADNIRYAHDFNWQPPSQGQLPLFTDNPPNSLPLQLFKHYTGQTPDFNNDNVLTLLQTPVPVFDWQAIQETPNLLQGKIVLLSTEQQAIEFASAMTDVLLQNTYQALSSELALSLQGLLLLSICGYLLLANRYLAPHYLWTLHVALSFLLLTAQLLTLAEFWAINLLPALLLIWLGQAVLSVNRMYQNYYELFHSHPDAVESNRLLGLAFQGQGQLELAFDKFRLCPADESIMPLLYNLGLDYETRQQPRHAAAVYRYMLQQHNDFRDVQQRLQQLQSRQHDWDVQASHQLGRYQIEKELGRGAMGTVYLGRDARLNRQVAIKTLPLSNDEFDAQETTASFFREASAAGRLHHPNIISVYDAGEQYDLAYIAMEFFRGGTLQTFTHKDTLLPVETVLQLMEQMALALDYAHRQHIIHRDIKPSNIMYNPANGLIKLTDFGIARVMDNRQTRTGITLGSPSYMSPEQVSGKHLQGTTDLYSLGVTMFELLSGELPFNADSIVSLTFKVTHEPHPDILQIRPDLPAELKAVIDCSMHKDPLQRYQTGQEFAESLQSLHTLESLCA